MIFELFSKAMDLHPIKAFSIMFCAFGACAGIACLVALLCLVPLGFPLGDAFSGSIGCAIGAGIFCASVTTISKIIQKR